MGISPENLNEFSQLDSQNEAEPCPAQRVDETGGVVNGEHEHEKEEPHQGIPTREG
jgi:hypothetical protein